VNLLLKLHVTLSSQILFVEFSLSPFIRVFVDHPVHAPASKGNPWDCEFTPDRGYLLRPVNGVYHVYKDQRALDNEEPCSFPYPNLDTFVADMNRLCAMIADGPL
jgi:AMP deaminase